MAGKIKLDSGVTISADQLKQEMELAKLRYEFASNVLDKTAPSLIGRVVEISNSEQGSFNNVVSEEVLSASTSDEVAAWTFAKVADIDGNPHRGVSVISQSLGNASATPILESQLKRDESGYYYDNSNLASLCIDLDANGKSVLDKRLASAGFGVDGNARCTELRDDLGLNYPLNKSRARISYDVEPLAGVVSEQDFRNSAHYASLVEAVASGYITENEFSGAVLPAVSEEVLTGMYTIPDEYSMPAHSDETALRAACGLFYPKPEGKALASIGTGQWDKHLMKAVHTPPAAGEISSGIMPKGLSAAVEAGAITSHELAFIVAGVENSRKSGTYEIGHEISICGNVDELDPTAGITRTYSASAAAARRRAQAARAEAATPETVVDGVDMTAASQSLSFHTDEAASSQDLSSMSF